MENILCQTIGRYIFQISKGNPKLTMLTSLALKGQEFYGLKIVYLQPGTPDMVKVSKEILYLNLLFL
jgi:hypothetical protein